MAKHNRTRTTTVAKRAAAARWAKAPDRAYHRAERNDSAALARITLLTRQQVAGHLGISVWTLDDWVRKSTFPKPISLSPGHARKWKLVDVDIWLARKAKKPEKPVLRGAVKAKVEARRR